MSFELIKKYSKNVDELFKAESKTSILTNTDYDWTGAHSVIVYKFATVDMNDYARNVNGDNESVAQQISRYGKLYDLENTTQEMLLKKDRSFIINVDKLDKDETGEVLSGGTVLARQVREVVIPEIDTYVYKTMVENCGTSVEATNLTTSNIYQSILDGSEILDDNEVPDTERVLITTPKTYSILKQAQEFDNTEVGAEMKEKGVIGILDGMKVIKVPASRLPKGFGFMIVHPSATTAPIKLEDYNIHEDTPLSSGDIVTGRVCYDCFVLENKKKGIYYQPINSTETKTVQK